MAKEDVITSLNRKKQFAIHDLKFTIPAPLGAVRQGKCARKRQGSQFSGEFYATHTKIT